MQPGEEFPGGVLDLHFAASLLWFLNILRDYRCQANAWQSL